MGLITTTTAEATQRMVTRITTMKIRDIQGEDVSKAVSTIRGALQHLETAQAVPNDIRNILIDIFSKTLVPEFNSIFTVGWTNTIVTIPKPTPATFVDDPIRSN